MLGPDGIIALGLDGAPYVCERGRRRIARVDPTTLAFHEYSLAAGAEPRQIALGGDGALYFSDWSLGRLGRLDPRDGLVDERHGTAAWPTSSGRFDTERVGLAASRGAVPTGPRVLVR